MERNTFRTIILSAAFLHCISIFPADNYTSYVDPRIGTGGHGHVFYGANVPFGFVQLGPTQHTRGWDWCSGYHHSDSILIGFSHLHLSGTGVGELGDILFLPVNDATINEVTFTHDNERCIPGYYSILLDFPKGGQVKTELTATNRTGFHRYSFSSEIDTARINIDLKRGIGWDKMIYCDIHQLSPRKISGCRLSQGWANKQQVFFVAEFSQDVEMRRLNQDTLTQIVFKNKAPMLVKVGLSSVSCENAELNLKQENPGWDFDSIVTKANQLWNEQLGKIKITTNNPSLKKTFYTSLYHTMVAPSTFCDYNGQYYGADGKIHHGTFNNLTTLSLWDTYRAWHPLSTLIHPEMQNDIAQTMLHIYQEQGKLPVWHLMGCETNCMVGNPAIPVLADMILKGFQVDKSLALEAMKKSAGSDKKAYSLLTEYGYIPYDLLPSNESIGKGMEYAIAYGSADKAFPNEGFKRLADSYIHYFDVHTGFMRARAKNGIWRESFDPFAVELNHIKDYTEGNAWQYIWLAPHDVHGLINLFNGKSRFASKLDSLFIVKGDLGADAPPDITGLIGQYAHGNEPSHHVAYLYNYIGQQWKTAQRVREIMETQYHNGIDGLCGNEDVGQMSAWYVLSSIGIYQADPAGGKYLFGSPLFDEIVINVGNGNTFKIVVTNNNDQNIYIQSVRLNGKKHPYSYINFKDIAEGGVLEMEMGMKPSKFGTKQKYCP